MIHGIGSGKCTCMQNFVNLKPLGFADSADVIFKSEDLLVIHELDNITVEFFGFNWRKTMTFSQGINFPSTEGCP